jgi:hypothetical protein
MVFGHEQTSTRPGKRDNWNQRQSRAPGFLYSLLSLYKGEPWTLAIYFVPDIHTIAPDEHVVFSRGEKSAGILGGFPIDPQSLIETLAAGIAACVREIDQRSQPPSKNATANAPAQSASLPSPPTPGVPPTIADHLKQLKTLKDAGVLIGQEYEAEKNALIDRL